MLGGCDHDRQDNFFVSALGNKYVCYWTFDIRDEEKNNLPDEIKKKNNKLYFFHAKDAKEKHAKNAK